MQGKIESGPATYPYRKSANNNVMHAKPDLRVFLKWMIADSGSVITDVMSLGVSLNNARFECNTSQHNRDFFVV